MEARASRRTARCAERFRASLSTRRCSASGWATGPRKPTSRRRCSGAPSGICHTSGMPDFWPSYGYRLLTVGGDGRLTLTDDFLRSQLLRPELAPVPESDAAERALHDALVADPRRPVSESQLAMLGDEDARANYAVWLRFRARLVGAPSIEAAYVGLFRGEGVDVPPVFVHQLTQVLVRHVLGEGADAMEARAGEMMFRAQRVTVLEDGAVMAADDETVEVHAS